MSVSRAGTYHYWLDGQQQTIIEPWEWVREGESASLKGQRIVDAHVLLNIRALYEKAQCTDLQLSWQGSGRIQHWRYRIQQEQLLWACQGGPDGTLELPGGCRLFPLLRAATGLLLPQLQVESASIVLPDIRQAPGQPGFLHPHISPRRAERINEQHWRYYGGEYGEPGSDYWLDEDGLVRAYRWDSPQGRWDVTLA